MRGLLFLSSEEIYPLLQGKPLSSKYRVAGQSCQYTTVIPLNGDAYNIATMLLFSDIINKNYACIIEYTDHFKASFAGVFNGNTFLKCSDYDINCVMLENIVPADIVEYISIGSVSDMIADCRPNIKRRELLRFLQSNESLLSLLDRYCCDSRVSTILYNASSTVIENVLRVFTYHTKGIYDGYVERIAEDLRREVPAE